MIADYMTVFAVIAMVVLPIYFGIRASLHR
jgi:hypothetical protein